MPKLTHCASFGASFVASFVASFDASYLMLFLVRVPLCYFGASSFMLVSAVLFELHFSFELELQLQL